MILRAGWTFAVSNVTHSGNTVTLALGYGGYQEGRGGYIRGGQSFYVSSRS